MTVFCRSIFEQCQIRKTRRQKDVFIKMLQERFPALTVQEGGIAKSRNLILGDVGQAKIVLSAHYDTCASLPFPNFISPKKPLLSILYSVLIAVPIIALLFVVSYLLNWVTHNFGINYGICMALFLAVAFLMLAGPANKHNANDNTSGVITLCNLYAALSPQERSKVAIVLFDHEELGLLGSAYFRKKYKEAMKNKLLINLDCVSDGDHILLAINKAARKRHYLQIKQAFAPTVTKQVLLENAERVYYPSDQVNFPVTVAVAALKYNKLLGFYMDRIHTRRDVVFDEKNIEFLTNALYHLITLL